VIFHHAVSDIITETVECYHFIIKSVVVLLNFFVMCVL